jgi:hypothetical protein
MVIRVALLVSCLIVGLVGTMSSDVAAGGPPVCPPPACGPAPYPVCPPPACGPAPYPLCPPRCLPPSPFTLCGSILGTCTSICGACIGIPAAIMRGLLAPPRPFPAPCGIAPPRPCFPSCGPPPCPPPRRITKCRRFSSNTAVPSAASKSFRPRVRTASALPMTRSETRFRLVRGTLTTPYASASRNTLADESITAGTPTLGLHW